MLTKENLIDAHKQGLLINTKNGNIKIVAILGDIYGVNHFNSNKVQWWLFEQFESQDAKIEQPKPNVDLSILKEGEIYYLNNGLYNYIFKHKHISLNNTINFDSNFLLKDNKIYENIGINISYVTELRLPTESELELFYSKFPDLKPKPKYNGRAVKCDTVEQANWLFNKINFDFGFSQINIDNCVVRIESEYGGGYCSIAYATKNNYEIISFSDYCKEINIAEPKWIQGFEVKDGYKDVVMVSDDNKKWYPCVLLSVDDMQEYPFETIVLRFKCCRYPSKNEINEIKFVD